jgi:hypothetical protein
MTNDGNNKTTVDKTYDISLTLKDVLLDKKYLDIRIIIICTSLITFFTWIRNSVSISCMLSIFQNVIMVFIITSLLLARSNTYYFPTRVKRGVIIGGTIGGIYAIILYIVENIDYYFFGGRELISSTIGEPAPPLNIYTVRAELFSGLWACIFLVILSAVIGLIAALLLRKPPDKINTEYLI